MPDSHAQDKLRTLVEWHAVFVRNLLERFNIHDIANDATPEMHLERLERELEIQGVLSSLPVTEHDFGRTQSYRLVHCDELFRANLPESGTGRELSLYVATFDDHFFLAPHLTDDQARAREWGGGFVSVSRGQWYGRADSAISWAVRLSGFDVDSVSLTSPRRSRSGQLGWVPQTFGSQPAECLWEMGFSADMAVSGQLLAVMNYLFLSEPGHEDESWFLPRRFAVVGPMLAVWQDPPTPQPAFSSSMIVLLSVDDPPSQDLAQQMQELASRRGMRLVVVYATGRWSSGEVSSVDLEETLEAALATAPDARCLAVHHGVAFDASTVAYQSALSAFRRRHPGLLLATEALPRGTAGEINGITFDQPSESDFLLELLIF